jgi:hypothetical protein
MRSVVLGLCLTFASTCTWSTPRPRLETILGRVIAYSSFPACLNGNGYWSMIIRQRSKDIRSEFIRVDFTLPCDRSPEWVSAKPSIQKFRLFRQKDCDAVLAEFMNSEGKQDFQAIPMWARPPGAEHDTLPFGQIVACYRSADLPRAPVL